VIHFRGTALDARQGVAAFAADVREGLGRPGQKTLPTKYLYDEVGSALFEAISRLPEYGLTRADERILSANAEDIVSRVPMPLMVAELGSGSGRKTRWILEAAARRAPTTYYPIDISPQALAQCELELGRLPRVRFIGLAAEYLEGLREVVSRRKRGPGFFGGERVLCLFLGSTIGNFPAEEIDGFLAAVRAEMEPGDALLLGTDLVKPPDMLIPAYDDAAGVTAAFNRNLLVRINRELGAGFDLERFTHEARWDARARRIEMHLRSSVTQTVAIPAADLTVGFRAGETIWTEQSHKYLPADAFAIGRRAGFRGQAQWLDREWPFAETLLVAK
jgi:dimethylhistidine N-methyltransferase